MEEGRAENLVLGPPRNLGWQQALCPGTVAAGGEAEDWALWGLDKVTLGLSSSWGLAGSWLELTAACRVTT